jgi:hypothetical protein
LDKFYTRPEIAAALAADALGDAGEVGVVLEPSAGGGAFVRAARAARPGVEVVALDVRPDGPEAAEILVRDFLAPATRAELLARLAGRRAVALGNPPFGHAACLAKRFVAALAALAPVARIALVLPPTFGKASARKAFTGFRLVRERPLPPDAFTLDGLPWRVPTCFQVWDRLPTDGLAGGGPAGGGPTGGGPAGSAGGGPAGSAGGGSTGGQAGSAGGQEEPDSTPRGYAFVRPADALRPGLRPDGGALAQGFDFEIVRVGGRAGLLIPRACARRAVYDYYIRLDPPPSGLRPVLRSDGGREGLGGGGERALRLAEWVEAEYAAELGGLREVASRTVGPRSLSKPELVPALNRAVARAAARC